MPKDDKRNKPTEADFGAAMLAWYAKAIEKFPDGLVSQAQAATMLGLSRMAISRLITRGHLRAVFFPEVEDDPEQPAFVTVAVGQDDPAWLKLIAWLSDWDKTYSMPKAAYVAFEDVKRLWESGKAHEKCSPDWAEIVAATSRGKGISDKAFNKFAEGRLKSQREREAKRLEPEVEEAKDGPKSPPGKRKKPKSSE